MAKPFFTPIDMNKLEIRNPRAHILASAPGSPVTGQFYYNSADNTLYWWNGTVWKSADGSAGGIAPSLYDAQSILGAVADNTPAAITFAASTIFGRKSTGDIGSMSMSQLVTELLAADGAGSSLDADLLDAQQGSYYLARANHTGTIASTDVSDFGEAVADTAGAMFTGNTETGITLTYQDADNTIDAVVDVLNALPAPTGSLSMNSQKIVSLLDPTSAQDAATKAYVDSVAQGLSAKASVRVASTAAVTLATGVENGDSIDGVTLVTGDRVLLKNQAAGAENGIYTVNASGAPTRALDFDIAAEVQAGAYFFVEEGSTNANSGWVLTTDGAITVGTTTLAFEQFSGAGQVTAGAALTKTGNTLDVAVDNSSIEVNADALRVKAAGITDAMLASTFCKKYTASIGDGSTTAIVVTHSLGTRAVTVSVHDAATYDEVIVDVQKTSTSTCTITFAVAPASNAYVVTIIG